jgi:hypothetical protein
MDHFQESAQAHYYLRRSESLISRQISTAKKGTRRTEVSREIEVDGEKFSAFEL